MRTNHYVQGYALLVSLGLLLERDGEVAAIHDALRRAVTGKGTLLVIEGPDGVGKSRLLAEARQSAADQGFDVLAGRGHILETSNPFGVTSQLLRSIAGAPPGIIDATGTPAPGADVFAILSSLHALLVAAAASHPLLVSVDDLHWADQETLRLLTYLSGRLDDLPLMLIVGLGPFGHEARSTLLRLLVTDDAAVVVRPRPLSPLAVGLRVHQVLAGEEYERGSPLGTPAKERSPHPDELSPEFDEACHRVTGGNPFLVEQLARTLARDGIRPSHANATRVDDVVPQGVVRAVLARMAPLPPGVTDLANALAVLGGTAELRAVADLADQPLRDAGRGADLLREIDLVVAGRPLQFGHPLVRSAIYHQLPLSSRQAMHRRAAEILAAAGSGLDAVAPHLAALEPAADPWVAERLVAAASDALRRSAPDTAVSYLRRALAEPPPPAMVASMYRALGDAEARRSQPAAAAVALRQALDLTTDPTSRGEIARPLAQALMRDGRAREAAAVVIAALGELPGEERELGLRLQADLQILDRLDAAVRTTPRPLPRHHVELVAPRSHGERLAIAGCANDEMNRGTASEAARLAELALGGGALLAEEGPGSIFFISTSLILVYADHLTQALRNYDLAISAASGQGMEWAVAVLRGFRAGAHLRKGSLAWAVADGRAALAGGRPHLRLGVPFAAGFLTEALVDQGELGQAAKLLHELNATGSLPDVVTTNLLQHARGRLREAQGDLRRALDDYLDCGRRAADWDMPSPAVANWAASAALVSAGLGERSSASKLAAEGMQAAENFGSPRGLGMALAIAGRVERDPEPLHEAVGILRAADAKVELARALVLLGQTLRHTNHRAEAREPLQAGLQAARTCGATLLAEQAHQELAATGVRLRKIVRAGRSSLTPSELRVAELAADGLTNSQVASMLSVSVRTVETHLARAYQKLDIDTRSQLAPALGRDPKTPALD